MHPLLPHICPTDPYGLAALIFDKFKSIGPCGRALDVVSASNHKYLPGGHRDQSMQICWGYFLVRDLRIY